MGSAVDCSGEMTQTAPCLTRTRRSESSQLLTGVLQAAVPPLSAAGWGGSWCGGAGGTCAVMISSFNQLSGQIRISLFSVGTVGLVDVPCLIPRGRAQVDSAQGVDAAPSSPSHTTGRKESLKSYFLCTSQKILCPELLPLSHIFPFRSFGSVLIKLSSDVVIFRVCQLHTQSLASSLTNRGLNGFTICI